MIVALSGTTGFIGRALIQRMRVLDWTLRMINRESFSLPDQEFLGQKTEGADVVINLAGAPVAKKWTAAYKKEIVDSRINTTRKISDSIIHAKVKPSLFISVSATGVYDSLHDHTESSTEYDNSYLSETCQRWEREALLPDNVTRVVILRLGVVLGEHGGVLQKMHFPFSIGLGGKLGTGKQAFSFIHIADLVEALMFIIENQSVSGVVNAVSPYPTDNREFTDKLAKVLEQPAWLTIPEFALRTIYGEASQVLLGGQRVFPEKLLQAGFRFRYPTIQNALVQIYG
jgi:uncharacterized protein